MFNDHLIFSNNIHDAAERLRQIQLNESGLKAAMKPGASHETVWKEILRQAWRESAHKQESGELAAMGVLGSGRRRAEGGTAELGSYSAGQQARDVARNVENLTPGDTAKRALLTKVAETAAERAKKASDKQRIEEYKRMKRRMDVLGTTQIRGDIVP
jgi:hypothetical protein